MNGLKTLDVDGVSLDTILKAKKVIEMSPDVIRTPILHHIQHRLGLQETGIDLYLKAENMQRSGKYFLQCLFVCFFD